MDLTFRNKGHYPSIVGLIHFFCLGGGILLCMLAKYHVQVCVHVYLVISKAIVQRVLQFAKVLLLLLFLPILSLLEDTQHV